MGIVDKAICHGYAWGLNGIINLSSQLKDCF